MQVLGERYRLVELIGTGGMSVVWRAFDDLLGRSVALKVLTADLASDPSSRRIILQEARAAARLAHPHVSVVHDFGEWLDANDAVMAYVVMELIDGPSLSDILNDGPLPWPVAAAIAAQVGSGLSAAHARGLVHRDVKPSNVVLAASGAKLVDFGIATIAGDGADDGHGGGELLGTPAYIAPERLTGGPTLPAADVYALGLLLYRSITGRMPWLTDGQTGVLRAHLGAEPMPLSTPDLEPVPDELAELCLRCLAKDPVERPSAAEVVRVLRALPGVAEAVLPNATERRDGDEPADTAFLSPLTFVPAPTAPAAGLRQRWLRRPAIVAAAVIGLVLLAGLGAAAATRDQPTTPVLPMQVGAPPARGACQATYHMSTDDGTRFAGDLTVVNTGQQTLRDWTLSFRYAGGQQTSGPGWSQTGDTVSVGPVPQELLPGKQVRLAFEGRYDGVNTMPTGFAVGDVACDAVLVGPVGTPRVEQAALPKPPAPKDEHPHKGKGKGKDKD
jgi:eukaryotic-like serine/threonine-protein kinase